jgi:hypothetical protein
MERTRVSIEALGSARTTAVTEMQDLALSAREVADYQDFLAYLNTRIFVYCQELSRAGGKEAVAGLPCPAGTGVGNAASGASDRQDQSLAAPFAAGTIQLPQETAATRTEKTGKLHDEFLESLGTFDQMLLDEEEKMASRVPSQRETAGTGGGHAGGNAGIAAGDGEAGSGERSSAAGAAAAAEDESTARAAGEGPSGRGEAGVAGVDDGAAGGADTGQAQDGVPAGSRPPPQDDDIVARQLREAAEKETDPELKKRLWEEYWRYKGVDKSHE